MIYYQTTNNKSWAILARLPSAINNQIYSLEASYNAQELTHKNQLLIQAIQKQK